MNEIKLNIYKQSGNEIDRTVCAQEYDVMFGAVTELMEIVKSSKEKDASGIVKAVAGAWNEVTTILSGFFPDVTAEEWRHVKLKDVVNVIVALAKYAVEEIIGIPVDPKN